MNEKGPTARPDSTRVAQLERDIAKAVNRLLSEFEAETSASPHAVDLEFILESSESGEKGRYVASGARVHFED